VLRLQDRKDTRVYLDRYLFDAVKIIFGAARAFPPPISREDVRADVAIATHWHEDHLEPGSIPVIARNNPECKLIMPPSARSGTELGQSAFPGCATTVGLKKGDRRCHVRGHSSTA
jgi:L-ascorbate metabolism protein UlaG (beta-lactamase superfamily)